MLRLKYFIIRRARIAYYSPQGRRLITFAFRTGLGRAVALRLLEQITDPANRRLMIEGIQVINGAMDRQKVFIEAARQYFAADPDNPVRFDILAIATLQSSLQNETGHRNHRIHSMNHTLTPSSTGSIALKKAVRVEYHGTCIRSTKSGRTCKRIFRTFMARMGPASPTGLERTATMRRRSCVPGFPCTRPPSATLTHPVCTHGSRRVSTSPVTSALKMA